MSAAELEATVEADSRRIDALVAAVSELTSLLSLQITENSYSIYADRELRAELELLSSRVKVLELRDRRRRARGDRRLLEAIELATDPLETAHDRHVAELVDRGYVVVDLESETPTIVGTFIRTEEEVVFFRGLGDVTRQAPADCVAIVTRAEAEAIVAGRRPR